jgi:hypothetical protein
MSFAVLGDLESDDENASSVSTKKIVKDTANLAAKHSDGKDTKNNNDGKTVLTAEQKAILLARKEQRLKRKAEVAHQKEMESRCFFYDECANKKQSPWPYCKPCYTSRTGKCETNNCPGQTTLSSMPGEFHHFCKSCRSASK